MSSRNAGDVEEITRLFQLYCFHTDKGDAVAWSEVFTEDASFDPGAGVVATGRPELARFISGKGGTSFHFAAPPVVDFEPDGQTATATSYVTVFDRATLRPRLLGVYHDRLRRTAEGWRIAYRRLERLERLEPVSRQPLYHLALAGDWDPDADEYRGSTLGRTLDEEGFVHCSTAEQLQATADRFYAGRTDVVLLTIDAGLLTAPVRVEGGFPHVYGPVPTAAVVAAVPVALGADGRLRIDLPGAPPSGK